MLRDQSFFSVLIINIFIAVIWHFAVFMICILMDTSFFNEEKKMYRPKKWERGGRFYSDTLKINSWKDIMPQYIGKNGFSKDHLDALSPEYLDEFIMETCRGEWNHTANCALCIVLMIINRPLSGAIFSLLVFAANMPFTLIQRYNRFRLQKLRQTLIRKSNRGRKGTVLQTGKE